MNRDFMRLSALAAEHESKGRGPNPRVPVLHRRDAVGVIVAGILFVADANQRLFQKPDDGREHALAGKASPPQIGRGARTDSWQSPRERTQAAQFRFISDDAPARVIAVLLPAPRITPGRLQVAVGIRTDPHVPPRRRDAQRTRAPSGQPIDGLAVLLDVPESFGRTDPPDARCHALGDVPQPGRIGPTRPGQFVAQACVGPRLARAGSPWNPRLGPCRTRQDSGIVRTRGGEQEARLPRRTWRHRQPGDERREPQFAGAQLRVSPASTRDRSSNGSPFVRAAFRRLVSALPTPEQFCGLRAEAPRSTSNGWRMAVSPLLRFQATQE